MVKKILAALISCFILVGLVVVYYWRDTQYQPESVDLIHYFLILPIVITFILLSPGLIYKAYQTYQQKKQQALETEKNQESGATEQQTAVPESKWLKFNLYAAGAYSALGENDEILEGIRAFTSPQLDHKLLNFQGLPILSYRIESLDQQLQSEEEQSFPSVRHQRITALIHHQIRQHSELLFSIAEHLKRSSLFYESQNLHEYRMHPAWIAPALLGNEDEIESTQQIEQVYRLDKLNLHILLSEDLVHTWNDVDSNESIQPIFHDFGIIPQKFHIEYHFLSTASTEQYLVELLERIQNQPHEISLLIAGDSEIDQEILDEKFWGGNTYVPAEYVSSSCLAHPTLQLEQVQPLKTLKLVAHQNNLKQIFKELAIHDLPQYQDEEPFVLVVEDGSDIKVVKKLEQFFNLSLVEPHHYLYCKPTCGHTQNVAKLFGLMLGAHFSQQQVAFVYTQDLKAFIQTVPEIEQDQASVAIAD